jgi:hypothetical protein
MYKQLYKVCDISAVWVCQVANWTKNSSYKAYLWLSWSDSPVGSSPFTFASDGVWASLLFILMSIFGSIISMLLIESNKSSVGLQSICVLVSLVNDSKISEVTSVSWSAGVSTSY